MPCFPVKLIIIRSRYYSSLNIAVALIIGFVTDRNLTPLIISNYNNFQILRDPNESTKMFLMINFLPRKSCEFSLTILCAYTPVTPEQRSRGDPMVSKKNAARRSARSTIATISATTQGITSEPCGIAWNADRQRAR